ncbi:MAG: esterase [Parcubacteria group bacterium]|nr:esterase [Parcubacteria group bacterium]
MKAIILPGNGGGSPEDNWSPYIERELVNLGIAVINTQFPDAELARKEYWLPFLKELEADENTVLIGHSSGAVAAMRYAETNKVLGSVLVAPSITDLGYETEKASHYFDDPWDWTAIRNNQQFILQFASIDDPYIPLPQAHEIHKELKTEYYEFADRGHFGQPELPELVDALKKALGK